MWLEAENCFDFPFCVHKIKKFTDSCVYHYMLVAFLSIPKQ